MNITEEQPEVTKKIKRRRAIKCTLIRASNSNRGYFKYEVTIQERDGSIHDEPCYGKDMQSALKRLINQEKTEWLGQRFNIWWVLSIWLVIMAIPTIVVSADVQPYSLLISFATIAIMFGLCSWWNYYISKGCK